MPLPVEPPCWPSMGFRIRWRLCNHGWRLLSKGFHHCHALPTALGKHSLVFKTGPAVVCMVVGCAGGGGRKIVSLRSAWSTQSSRSDRTPQWDPVCKHTHTKPKHKPTKDRVLLCRPGWHQTYDPSVLPPQQGDCGRVLACSGAVELDVFPSACLCLPTFQSFKSWE